MNITTLSELKKSFKSAFEQSPEKQFLIENEIREINNFVTNLPIPRAKRNIFSKYYPTPKGTAIFDLDISNAFRSMFSEAFNTILRTGENEVIKYNSESDQAFLFRQQISQQAFELVNYYKWLNELKSTPHKLPKRAGLSHKQKLLALHYLGLDTSKFDNSALAKILAEVLELSVDNTRQYLSYISAGKNNNVRTKSNLEKVNQLFQDQGLTDISNKIKSDLEKV